jgi:L-seryl-tRNA(Ser) seleniumtransferase
VRAPGRAGGARRQQLAAATLLAAPKLAGPGRELVVSGGQLIEIGDDSRIPEVIAQSGSQLVESARRTARG